MDAEEIASELDQINRAVETVAKRIDNLRSMLFGDMTFPAWANDLVRERVCLVCREKVKREERYLRGCHERCRKQIERSIEAGELTDAQAVALGKLAAKKSPGRPPKNYKMTDEERQKVAEWSEEFNEESK